MESLGSIKHLRRKHMSPHAVLADPGFVERLGALGLSPWEVISSREFAAVGDFNPRALADWRYAFGHLMNLPQPEAESLFSGNVRYYRLDVLKDWHAGRGVRPTDRSTLWQGAADYLASQHVGRPQSARQTDELLDWLWHHHIFHLRTLPKRVPYLPYSGRQATASCH